MYTFFIPVFIYQPIYGWNLLLCCTCSICSRCGMNSASMMFQRSRKWRLVCLHFLLPLWASDSEILTNDSCKLFLSTALAKKVMLSAPSVCPPVHSIFWTEYALTMILWLIVYGSWSYLAGGWRSRSQVKGQNAVGATSSDGSSNIRCAVMCYACLQDGSGIRAVSALKQW